MADPITLAALGAGLLGAGGSIGGAILGRPKTDTDIFGGFDPTLSIVNQLFGMPTVRGRGGLMVPSEGPIIQQRLSEAFARGGLPAVQSLAASGALGTGWGAGPFFGFEQALPAFTPYDWGGIRDILEPVPTNALLEAAPGVAGEAIGGVGRGLALLRGGVTPTVLEALQTGLPTDISGIARARRRTLERETIPGLAEQYAGLTGSFSTDFLNAITQAGADVETQLGALEADAQERAMQRRMAAVPLAGLVAEAETGIPLGAASDFLNLGQQLRDVSESLRPGTQILRALTALGQAGGRATPFSSTTYTPGLSGLTEAFGQFGAQLGGSAGQALGGLFSTQPSLDETLRTFRAQEAQGMLGFLGSG